VSHLNVLAVGDVFLDRADLDDPWDDLVVDLQKHDLRLCNYEAPISDRGTPMRDRVVWLRSPSTVLPVLHSSWDAMSLAQNHMMDFGEEAARDTVALCSSHAIPVTGVGENSAAALQPIRLERPDLSLSVFAVACAFPRSTSATETRWGVATVDVRETMPLRSEELEHPGAPVTPQTHCVAEDLARVCNAVQAEVALGRHVLVYVHWGVPGVTEVLDYQRELAVALVDAGVDAVLGTHAHVLQGVEIIRGVPVLYGLSHIVFDMDGILTRWPRHSALTMAASFRLGADGVSGLRLIPYSMTESGGRSTTVRLRDTAVHDEMVRLCAPFGTSLTWDSPAAVTRVGL